MEKKQYRYKIHRNTYPDQMVGNYPFEDIDEGDTVTFDFDTDAVVVSVHCFGADKSGKALTSKELFQQDVFTKSGPNVVEIKYPIQTLLRGWRGRQRANIAGGTWGYFELHYEETNGAAGINPPKIPPG